MLGTPELQHILYKDGRLAFRDVGQGPALLFFHGMNGTSQSWAFIFEALASSFRLVAWDAPSFGASDVFGDGIDDYVDAAKALMKALHLKDTIVIGHSMGGVVAAQLAADKDTSVAGLVLSSTHLGFAHPKGETLMERYATRIDRMQASGVNMAYGLERAKRSTPEGTSEAVVEFLTAIGAGARIESIRDGGRMSQEADNTKISADVTVPVLILSGGKDKVISQKMHAELAAAFPKAQQEVFPNAGHASYAECPDLFCNQLNKFTKWSREQPGPVNIKKLTNTQ